jgi:hypothetical protein
MPKNSFELDSAKLLAVKLDELTPFAHEDTIVTVDVVRLEDMELEVSDLGKSDSFGVMPEFKKRDLYCMSS